MMIVIIIMMMIICAFDRLRRARRNGRNGTHIPEFLWLEAGAIEMLRNESDEMEGN